MNMQNTFMDSIDQIADGLKSFTSLLPEQDLQNFRNLQRDLQEALREEEKKGKTLRLGIVGSVKAGKSTFLNALLFDGDPVLPKAATPMTASLTRLRFSSAQFVRFVYYTREDWKIIKEGYAEVERKLDKAVKEAEADYERRMRTSPEYYPPKIDRQKILSSLDVPETQRACHQLVEQAKKNGLDLDMLLGHEHSENIDNLGDLAPLMREYIGSDGRYSPIVKYVELGLNNNALKDMEIVDTPGLNDPVRSRSEETYRFICQCDAVFLLSRASQFLTEEDMELLRRTLVDSGIKEVTVIATQMDLGAQNEVGKTQSYREAIARTLRNIMQRARNTGVPQTPIPVSSIFEIIARKMEKGTSLDEDERQINLNIARFPSESPRTAKDFHYFANMEDVRKELGKYRAMKDKIIEEHQEARARESRRNFLEILDSMIKTVDTQSRILQDYDMSSLKKLRAGLLDIIENVNHPISNFFSVMEREAGQKFADLKNRVISRASDYESISVSSGTRQEKNSYTTGHLWWKKTHTDYFNITYFYAQLADALQQLRAYAAKCEEDINRTVKELFSKDEIQQRLKAIVLPLYRKFEQENIALALNEDMIILPVNSLIQKFTIPEWNFDNTPYNTALKGEFSGKIENDTISSFKTAYETQLQNLGRDIRNSLDARKSEICDTLAKASVNFAGDIRHRLEQQTDAIEEQMKNREESLKKYGECRETLEQYKRKLVG